MFWFFKRSATRKPFRAPALQVEGLEPRVTPYASTLATVGGQANIYAAGLAAPTAPGGGGAGTYPAAVRLATFGNPATLDFPAVTGKVSGWAAADGYNGPDGGTHWGGVTDVPELNGISGIRHTTRTMFLIGVFLGPDGQPTHAPPTLDVTGANTSLMSLPRLGQQFFVGDGRTINGTLQTVVVPAGAVTLYLGFAESRGFGNPHTLPGYYGDNGGALRVEVEAAAQRHWSPKNQTVIVPPSLAVRIDQIADAYFSATAETFVVTDGVRTATKQAAEILSKLQNDGEAAVRRLYHMNPALIDEVIISSKRGATDAKRLDAMTATIRSQMDRGEYVSRHLTGRAFDVRSRDMSQAERNAFAVAVRAAGGLLVDETDSAGPHFHVQF